MGLRFATDLEEWRHWQRGRDPLRAIRARWAPHSPGGLVLHVRGAAPSILFAVEATTPSAIAATTAALVHLNEIPVAVVAPSDVSARLPGAWAIRSLGSNIDVPHELREIHTVIASGHYLPAGAAAYSWAERLDALFVVVQHGLLTPFSPPLPPRAALLAFSERDAAYWTSGRTDVTASVVGSQLLWAAAQRPRPPAIAERPLFLGQLHGAELSRRVAASTAARFCRDTGADYRPHPAEIDRRSRWQHERWRRRGIRVITGGELIAEPRPVVSIFSTGVLEAAAAGIPSWVTCVRPPEWVREFWERYALSRWGESATPAPAVPEVEPAAAVARAALGRSEKEAR